nr:MAG TPA: protein of unknown function DUF4508 [Caudoviricetes sp.]
MTQINYEAAHRALWNWLADHSEAEKDDYFEDWDAASVPKSRCFACEVAHRKAWRTPAYHRCRFCPLGGESVVGCDSGLFDQWWESVAPETRRKLALQIAKLPWKEK